MNENLKSFLEEFPFGDWKQCGGSLRKKDSICFLGAMMEYYKEKHPERVQFSFDNFGCGWYNVDGDRKFGFLQAAVLDWYGIDRSFAHTLGHLNDKDKKSFRQIVDFIKKAFEK